MEALRLRLKFDDSVLTDSQKSDGFKRSWVSVEPRHQTTVSDFVSHLLHSFDLCDSCPDGILLSMEGFALPHFESIAILNDNDLVCVKRRGSRLLDGVDECGEEKAAVEEKAGEGKGVRLLQNEEFEEESGGYQSETDEEDEDDMHTELLHEDNVPNGNAPSKKRKASKHLKNSKKKRRFMSDESSSLIQEHPDSYLQNGYHQRRSSKHKPDQVHNAVLVKKRHGMFLYNMNEERNLSSLKGSSIENGEVTLTPSNVQDGTVKASVARSTRRKRAQRQWRRTLHGAGQEQLLKKKPLGEYMDVEDHPKESDQDTDGEIVPVVVRPGHIRFVAPGKEKSVQQYQEEEGLFNWHGIMKKKKGQKWKQEKQTSYKRNEYKKQPASKWNECRATQDKESASKWNELRSPKEKQSAYTWGGNRSTDERQSGSKWNNYRNHGRNWASQKATSANASMDYEKLVPMTDFPVLGETIAYRLLEMSSSFCPQLTSYRVGEVAWSDQESNRVRLVPIPEYPFEFKKGKDDKSNELDDAARYKEDGSLEIDFPSLADVRIVKRGGMNPSTPNSAPASGWNPASSGLGWGGDNTVGNKAPSSWAQSTGSKWTKTSSWAAAPTPTSGWGSTSESGSKWTKTSTWATAPSTTSGWGSTSESGWRTETPGSSKDHQSETQPMSNNWTGMDTRASASATATENGNKDVWEKMSEALNAKKAECLKEDNWNKKPKSVSYSGSYRSLRSNAGPTMGRFRARNGRGRN